MIYGYESRTLDEHGLKQMREISLEVRPDTLRELSKFLMECADELETAVSDHWHRHTSAALQREVGCDVIVLGSN
jgi:hypothetical protein